MLVPLSWLKDFVDIDVTPQELEEKLFSGGFEVEELTQVGKDISGVVVGFVESCEPIPDTHLHVCMVNAGGHGTMQVCCGADNVAAGGKYPLALPGAVVYATAKDHKTVEGLMTIKKGKLRGYESCGMLCSGVELGVSENMYPGAGYNGLLVLPDDAEPGADVKPVLGLDDWLFDIAITANRPDCQSIFGVAREVAALLGKELHMPALDYTETAVEKEGFAVTVQAPDLCPRYMAHYIYDVTIGESPAWMKRRLSLVGIDAISNIVDITNYVLKEIGQPMHAFDCSYLEGNAIDVRRAMDGEKIVTLDSQEYELSSANLVICDGVKPVALAGVMGGLNSEIRDTTAAVMFESAKFARDNIRKTARALGKHSDASARYEKGVDEYSVVMGLKRALHLVEELGCGKVSGTHKDVNTGNSLEPRALVTSVARVNGVLGIEVPTEDILRILSGLQMQPTIEGDVLTLQIPAYRDDMESYQDVAEEVIRMYGYDHVTPTLMPTAKLTVGGLNDKQKNEMALKKVLCSAGAYECMHYSFFSPADLDMLGLAADAPERHAIRLINPINEDLSLMRTTLAASMINAMARNQKRGNMEGRLFEIGNIFLADELPLVKYPEERQTLCVGIFGAGESFYTLKGIAETVAKSLFVHFEYERAQKTYLHPYRTAQILCEGRLVGCLGQVSYEIQEELNMRTPAYLLELDLEELSQWYGKKPVFEPLPKFAEEKRDLALVMDKAITCGQVEKSIAATNALIREVKLFDVYEGAQIPADKKSMAFTVTFVPKDEALTAEKVDKIVAKILKRLEMEMGITLRA